jgi:farnesyl-diphosphate farnesyltransferase
VTSATTYGSTAMTRSFCDEMLPKVSRTFAICIRMLPPDLEHSVQVAYLLCRVADTIEDTTDLTLAQKEELLLHFGRCLDADGPDAAPLHDTFVEASSDEELLAREADVVLAEFHRLPEAHKDAIRPWVQEMCSGMAEFAGRTNASPTEPESLASIEDLERYCYYVAGTVGHLLTELFRQYDPTPSNLQYEHMKSLATSFGLGLQLTNIIKDVADDRRRGRSFMPRQLCQVAGVTPGNLQGAGQHVEAREVLTTLIEKAKNHLCDALEYSTTLPRGQYGIRNFCLTSLYFAVRTLRLAERDPRLVDPTYKVKISRREVYRTILTTRLVAPVNSLVRAYFRLLAGEAWWRHCRERVTSS